MIHPYSRRLDSIDLIQHFLSVVLRHERPNDRSLLNLIRSGEAELKNYETQSTLYSTSHRDREYVQNTDRWRLRKQIVAELATLLREQSDESISLGNGGALPHFGIKKEKKAIIIIGLPASGKSSIANKLADHHGAVILDADFAKRKFPEFKDSSAGASLVHDESDVLIFGYGKKDKPDDFRSLIEICSSNDYNIVIPKIGHSYKSVNDLAKALKLFGYETHLVLVSLDRRLATLRAADRFVETKRYVPLSLIFDGYGNDPVLSFYRLKDNIMLGDVYIASYGKISTDVPRGEDPIVIYADTESPVCLFKK